MRGRLIWRYLFGQHTRLAFLVLGCLFVIVLLSQFSNYSQYQSQIEGWGFAQTLMISVLRTPLLLQAILPHTILVSAALTIAMACRRLEVAVLMQNGFAPTQLILPTILSAAAIGLFAALVFNPLAVAGHNLSEQAIRTLTGGGAVSLRKNPREVYIREDGGAIYVLIDDVVDSAAVLDGVTYYAVDGVHVLQRTLEAERAVRVGTDTWQLEDAVELYRAPGLEDLPPPEGFQINFEERALDRRIDTRDQIGIYELPDRIRLSRIVGAQVYEPQFRLAWLIALPALLGSLGYLSGSIVIRPLQRGGWKYDAGLVLLAAFAVYTVSTVLEALAIRGVIGPVTAVSVVPCIAAVTSAVLIWLKRGGNRILRSPFGKRAQAMHQPL
ncbi:LptF/LptG family permease [Anianabacter salinae]|uniref:LptF/LptG family permease n=1 Tax=Anianabacter salinae TaxID=2851023 RepID=UPI00225E5F94|nr:LptF/LptG family permease [Anianabacter salinae]MBV0912353.1 LptF/LptG family permease [Anianabacter salinae]